MDSTSDTYIGLVQIDSGSSVDSDATAPNLPGPGRTVGILYDHLGGRLESVLNRRAAQLGLRSHGGQANTYLKLDPVYTNSSVDTNATAPNLPGAGRTVGLLLDFLGGRLESILNIGAAQVGLNPDGVIRAIRAICRHEDRSLAKRHKYPVLLSKSELKNLKRLCKRLIEYSRSRVKRTQLQALEEIMKLSVEDPLIRSVLAGCNLSRLAPKYNEPDLITSHAKTLACIVSAAVHKMWSEAIARNGRTIERNDTGHHCNPYFPSTAARALVSSLRDTNNSFLAARYLLLLFRQYFPGGLQEPRSIYIEAYSYMWEQYIWIARQNPRIIEWSNVNSCIAQLSPSALEHQHPIRRQGSSIADMARSFFRQPQDLTSIVDKFLKKPQIEYTVGNFAFGDTFKFTRVGDWTLDSLTHLRFLLNFIQELSDETLDDADEQFAFVRGLDSSTKRRLSSTVFADEAWIAYCHLSLFAISGEHVSLTSRDEDQLLVPSCSWKWDDFLSSISVLTSCFENSDIEINKDISSFLISRFVSLDRYCKFAVWGTTTQREVLWSRLNLSPEIAKELNDSVDENEWDPLRTMYYQSPCLFRFRAEGELHVVDSESAKYQISMLLMKHIGHELFVDIMTMKKDTTMWHPATGVSFGDGKNATSYDATGHFPILAGESQSGVPLFVARSKITRCLSCVAEGESTIRVTGRNSEFLDEDNFSVLGLRHDPCDMYPPYPHRPEGAKDPTGPLYWLRFWPDKDEDFPVEYSNMEEIIRLETFLNVFSKSVNPLTDSVKERNRNFQEALAATAPASLGPTKNYFWVHSGEESGVPVFREDGTLWDTRIQLWASMRKDHDKEDVCNAETLHSDVFSAQDVRQIETLSGESTSGGWRIAEQSRKQQAPNEDEGGSLPRQNDTLRPANGLRIK